MNELTNYPGSEELIEKHTNNQVHEVNGHFHTPYSFSAFKDIPEVFEMAKNENIKVLGINDFYTTSGYEQFYQLCQQHRIFPLFNIEFIGLNREHQQKGIRVNDPNNPGRTYFSGKGLDYPLNIDAKYAEMIKNLREESMKQVEEMIRLLNNHLDFIGSPFKISIEEILEKYASDLVRERHVAKALRIQTFNHFQNEADRNAFLFKLYSGKAPKANIDDINAVEDEMRGNLLKSGGVAFVADDPNSFLDIEVIRDIILNAGGIPCYPVLLDNKNGEYTDFEDQKEEMRSYLASKNVFCIELIPGRNSIEALEPFVKYFRDNQFIVTFGTEHNTPKMAPLKVSCRNGELSKSLKQTGYEGACVIAAHEYLRAKGKEGYVNDSGQAKQSQIDDFIKLGDAVINKFINASS